jgi:integrase
MYSKTPTGKASKGSVSIINSNGRLQLRFRHGGTRHYISLGVPDSPEGRKLAEMKAREIELDILSGNFDSTTG